MIRYKITHKELYDRIAAAHPPTPGKVRKNANQSLGWHARAQSETTRVRNAKTYTKGSWGEFWQELKPIFVQIQLKKCGYCEGKLQQRRRTYIGDIDHYRPKDSVKAWYFPDYPGLQTGGADPDCYYLLAFEPSNYVLSCPVCNEEFKKNYFPIAGLRCSAHSDAKADLIAEHPYLLHPLDPDDADPEDLIEFEGITPIARAPAVSHDYWRARVTIELFGLTGEARQDLNEERAEIIFSLYSALQSSRQKDKRVVVKMLRSSAEHCNCARSFKRLYDADVGAAEALVDLAIEAMESD